MANARLLAAAISVFLVLCVAEISVVGQAAAKARPVAVVKAKKFLRTELYFGRSRSDGTLVSDDDWKRFLAEVVTPRFPEGFTSLNATGQYKDHSGRIVSEPSEVLVFLYPRETRKANGVRSRRSGRPM